jgi:poly-gamma-glutamate capsule biosynthesis protein CapA/YwtB (metallophosphatase superfamily)
LLHLDYFYAELLLDPMRFFLPFLLTMIVISSSAQRNGKDTIAIIGVGDIMLGTSYPEGYLPPDDGKYLLKPVEKVLQNADITFGNHEGTLFDGEGIPKQCENPALCYAFKSPERYAQYLKDAGFDLMSVANNHSGDFGPQARKRTMQVLQAAGIASSGTIEKPFVVLEKGGVRYGLASFAPNYGTQSITNYSAAREIVSYLDSLCDIVIVSFHGGAEGKTRQHVPRQNEIFVGENRGNVYKFARTVIDAGADVVFGHGPHVTRAVDLYKDRFIIYSLGNFATYGRFNLKGPAGIAPIMKVLVDKKGKFLKGEIIPARQVGEGGPALDDSGAVIEKIRELTKTDFPETRLRITADGEILKKKKSLD